MDSERVIKHHPFWDVYDCWCWGNCSKYVASFFTKEEAKTYVRKHGRSFNGFEGLDIHEPYDIIERDGHQVFRFCGE